MQKQKVFTVVKVEDDCPPNGTRHFVQTIRKHGIVSERQSTFDGEWINDFPFADETVTHWLKEGEKYVFGEDELIELLKDVWDYAARKGFTWSTLSQSERKIMWKEFVITKGIVKT